MSNHLNIGGIVFEGMDQIDFTGAFEVLSLLPDSKFHVLAKEVQPVGDQHGLILTPEMRFADAPRLDVLLVPGGFGQEELMDDEPTMSLLRSHVAGGGWLLSVCTGALLCGAAGLLRGLRATTHWRSLHLLSYFGAIPVDERVVVEGRIVTTGGLTAGIDGALRLAALLCGEAVAQQIQLYMQYAPEPPFACGHPSKAPAAVLAAARRATEEITRLREATARRLAQDERRT
jgi:cyclohexyl-isocyanide hydratase